jgi:CBS domain-containing protein
MHVAHLLKVKGESVITIGVHSSVAQAAERLLKERIGALVVTGALDPLAGILSERDIVAAIGEHGAAALDFTVQQLMTTEVFTCTPSTTVHELMALMTEQRVRHVPVVSDGHLIGLVSIGDIVKARLNELEGEQRDLLDYISAR